MQILIHLISCFTLFCTVQSAITSGSFWVDEIEGNNNIRWKLLNTFGVDVGSGVYKTRFRLTRGLLTGHL